MHLESAHLSGAVTAHLVLVDFCELRGSAAAGCRSRISFLLIDCSHRPRIAICYSDLKKSKPIGSVSRLTPLQYARSFLVLLFEMSVIGLLGACGAPG